MKSYHYKQDGPHREDLAAVAQLLGYATKSGALRYLVRAKLLELEAAERGRQEQAAADLARERARMAPYAAPEGPEDEEDDIEDDDDQADDQEDPFEADDVEQLPDEDDETPDVDPDDDGDDLDPGDMVEFAPEHAAAGEELRQLEALAEIAEGLPTSAGWAQIVGRCMVLLATLAPVAEVARLASCHKLADPAARVDFLLSHCRRWLLCKSLLN